MGNSRGRATYQKKMRNRNEAKRLQKLEKRLRNESKKTASKE
ncbi:MAG: hypothetical protein ACJASX_003732 [Limisphaerales bacterium]|jgi:hypothetical protein